MDLVSAGSADRMVHIWEPDTCSLAYQLPGHTGSVNEVAFHLYSLSWPRAQATAAFGSENLLDMNSPLH